VTGETLRAIDQALTERVLVYGSLPPDGRDLDLLVRPTAQAVIERLLTEQGFEHRRSMWIRFADCSATAIDITPAPRWKLPSEELESLYADAIPLEGCTHLVRPAPHHQLLILARRNAREQGLLDMKRRRRLEDAVAEDADAWRKARAHAAAWREEGALRSLQEDERQSSRHTLTGAAHRARRVARGGLVVTLSGLDGAGKSSQAAALRDALKTAGVDAVVEWLPLGQNPSVERASALVRRVLHTARRAGRPTTAEQRAAAGESLLASPGSTRERSPRESALLHAWATVVAVANALHQRATITRHAAQGRVVIFDRYTLDSIVRLRYLYGDRERFTFQAFLIRAVSPRPLRSFLLDVRAETALGRKDDRWSLNDLRRQSELYREEAERLGVLRLDGERPRDVLCTEIAREVWRALP
jgi:thymidylate kinase